MNCLVIKGFKLPNENELPTQYQELEKHFPDSIFLSNLSKIEVLNSKIRGSNLYLGVEQKERSFSAHSPIQGITPEPYRPFSISFHLKN